MTANATLSDFALRAFAVTGVVRNNEERQQGRINGTYLLSLLADLDED